MSDTSEMPNHDNDRYTVPALERGLRLLACFSPSQPVWSAPDLARTLALPRSTVFRMLTTLEGMGYLQRAGTEYRLGLSVLRLGYDYLSTQPLAQLAEPVLQSLCERLGFTTNLALRDGTSVVYVARIAPPGAFQGAVRVGSRLPAHATVLGRAAWTRCCSCCARTANVAMPSAKASTNLASPASPRPCATPRGRSLPAWAWRWPLPISRPAAWPTGWRRCAPPPTSWPATCAPSTLVSCAEEAYRPSLRSFPLKIRR